MVGPLVLVLDMVSYEVLSTLWLGVTNKWLDGMRLRTAVVEALV
jgi:hypothetical protein